MLTHNQIIELSKICDLKIRCCDGVPISVYPCRDKKVKYPYEDFRKRLGLEDLRLSWLLGKNNIIAGGSVLNWIWGENTNTDIDFFFKDQESSEIFVEFIKGIGFKLSGKTSYAETYFEKEQALILQVVNGFRTIRNNSLFLIDYDEGPKSLSFYGMPFDVISSFDIHLCRFAVDNEYIYTTKYAIQSLFRMTVSVTGKQRDYAMVGRLLKYVNKGFVLSPETKSGLSYNHKGKGEEEDADWF